MSSHVLLNVSNEWGKEIKCEVSLFCNEFHKFNNTGARLLDFVYHMTMMTLKLF